MIKTNESKLQFLLDRLKDEQPFDLVGVGGKVYMSLRFLDGYLYKQLPDKRGLVYINYLGFNDLLNSEFQERKE